jgi:hypothetical protein
VKRRMTTWTAAIVLALTGVAAAQEQATVLKRDGTRVSGRFEAWNRNTNTLYLRLSLADQRIIPFGDAAVLEIAGNADNLPASELEAARGDDHILVTRNGEVLRGRLVNIEGGEGSGQEDGPRMVSFKPAEGAERRFRFNELRRLYLGRVPATLGAPAVQLPAEVPTPAGAVRVAANAGWVATNVVVRRTDRLQFSATGRVTLSTDAEDEASPAGSLKGRYVPNGQAPTVLAGALLGRIGNGPPFAIGDQTQALPVPAAGQLFLAVNDDQVNDNQGAFIVSVQVVPGRR